MQFGALQTNSTFLNTGFSAFKFQPKVSDNRTDESTRNLRTNPLNVAQNTLAEKLSGVNGIEGKLPTPSNFSPEEIAKNVLSFVTDKLKDAKNNGANQEKLQSILNDAKAGVAQGFKEASEILQKQGLLTDDTQTGLNKAQDLIINGLSPTQQPAQQSRTTLFEASQTLQETRKQGFKLNIKTQDGDVVTLKFRQSEKQSSSVYYQQTEGQTSIAAEASTKSKSQFSFSVKGELDEDELKSINKLVGDINEVADTFFNGDAEAAFEQGLNLGFNTDEIASFSLNLKQSAKSVATTQYREVSEFTPEQTRPPKSQGIGHIVSSLNHILKQASSLFEDANDSVNRMFAPLLENNSKSDLLNAALKDKDKDFDDLSRDLLRHARKYRDDD